MSRRTRRVGELLQIELADLLLRKVQDPRIHDCTVTAVTVTPDLSQARVAVSALGDEAERLAVIDSLTHARGFLRSQLAHRLRHMKRMPELRFELDRGAEHSQNISDLLEELNHDDRS
jgi:ribosome-binding factor A